MPKMKTHRSSAKRFRLSESGKLLRSKAYKSHILTKKTSKRKRNLRRSTVVSAADQKKIKELLPYI